MREHVLKTYEMTLANARKLVADVPCDDFARCPHEFAKHPGWVLGHLSGASVMGSQMMGVDLGPMQPWMQAAMGAPTGDRAIYGKKAELLAWMEKSHEGFAKAFRNATDAQLAAELPFPDYRSFWPTVADAAFYLMAHHEGYHLGQLSSWRRAVGLKPAE